MLCPRCSVGDIPEGSDHCVVCGFTPGANVIVEQQVDETLEAVRQALADQFRITAILNVGERSFLYGAHDINAERLVALKVIPIPGGVRNELAQRFAQQAGIAASLSHAHVVPVYGHGSQHGFLWYSMEHVHARPLTQRLRDEGPMDLLACRRVVEQIAIALDHAHRQNVIHGNVKPSNVFVDPAGWVRVSDFAVLDAFRRGADAKAHVPVVLRPEYMAPEQFFSRAAGPSADQYALAILTVQCLTGELPVIGDSPAEMARLHQDETAARGLATRLPDVPDHVVAAIQRGLSRSPVERFPTVLDFSAALSVHGRPSRPTAQTVSRRSSSSNTLLVVDDGPRRKAWRWIAGLGVVAALAAGVAYVGSDRVIQTARSLVEQGRAALQGPAAGMPELVTEAPAPGVRQQSAAPPAADRVESRDGGVPTTAAPARRAPAPTVTPARLFVNARPWGEVYVDGEFQGNTPRAALELSPGRHVIEVRRDGFVTFGRTIDVSSGQVVRLTDIVLEPLQEP